MEGFIQKYQKNVTGVLSGWDRVRIRGMQRILANVGGMMSFLSHVGVRLKDFGAFVERTCLQVRQASEQAARRLERPVHYLRSSTLDKYAEAENLARHDYVQEGLVCVFSCVEPCQSYKIQSDRATKTISLQKASRKCVHLYHYWMDKDFGLMHARLQTWFPLPSRSVSTAVPGWPDRWIAKGYATSSGTTASRGSRMLRPVKS